MKKPLVPWTCGSVCRNSGRLGCRNCAQPSIGSTARPDASTTRLGLVCVDRADRVDDRAAGPHALGGRRSSSSWSSGSGCERQRRSGRAARTPSPEHGASTSARSKPVSSGGSERPSAWTTRTFAGAETVDVLLELARTRLVRLDRGHLAREHRRLAAGRGAQVEDAFAVLRADDEAGELRAAALRPDLAPLQGFLVDARDLVRAGDVRRRPVRDRSPDVPDHRRRRLVLRPHQRQRRLLAEVAPPDVPHPVRVGVLERPLRQLRQQPLDPVADPAEHGVRERDGALEPGAADELHRFVHGGVPRHTAEEAELVGAEPERREHGRRRASARAACRASRSRGRASAPAAPSRRRAAARATGRGRRASRDAVRSARSA